MIYSKDYSKEDRNRKSRYNKKEEKKQTFREEKKKEVKKEENRKKELVEKKATTYVNVREGAGFDKDVARILKTGEVIEVFYEPGAEWLKTKDGKYIKAEFLK